MLSVGEILKKRREVLGINLKNVEKEIKIREKFLTAVEQNNWNIFSSKIYIAGIIKNYSQYLDLDPERTLAFFRRDYEKKETVRFKRKIASKYLTPETRKIVFILIFAVFVIFFSYFGYQLKQYFSPPALVLLEPKTDVFKKKDKIKIVGLTEKDAAVTIFGERIYQNKEGVFTYEFPLKVGENELSIEVVGANGKKTVLKEVFIRI